MFSQEAAWLLSEKYQGKKNNEFFADLAKLRAGVPIAYLIGHIPFLHTTIHLDSHPLIPRPETEFWTEQALHSIQTQKKNNFYLTSPIHILDLCAGSGAIGVALATALPGSLVDFAELDPTHLPTIAKNCRTNGITPTRVHIYASNLFTKANGDPLPRYTHIVSNPPYIDQSLGRTENSVILHEPALALYGGTAGLEIITAIIIQAKNHLVAHGTLWLEHEPEQVDTITSLGTQQGYTVSTHPDQYGVLRYSVLVLQ